MFFVERSEKLFLNNPCYPLLSNLFGFINRVFTSLNFAIIQVLPFLNNPKGLDPSYKLDLPNVLKYWDT